MQTQEDHSINSKLNVDSLKVDLVVIQNTCSEKEDSNSETASSKLVKECSLNSETKDVHAIKYKMLKAKERCMAIFESLIKLHSSSKADLKGTHVKWMPRLLGGKQPVPEFSFQSFIGFMTVKTETYFVDTLDSRTEINSASDSSRSGNDTYADDVDIRPIYDEEPMAEVGVDQYQKTSKKKIQERDRNSTTSVPTSARIQTTTDDRKPNPRSNKQTSRSLLWIRTEKLFDSCISKVDSEPPHGSNVDIPHIHECKQSLDLSAETIVKVDSQMMIQKNDVCSQQFRPQTSMSNDPRTTVSTEVHQAVETVTTSNELDLLFGPLFDEYFNGENQVVLKSSAVTTTDASNKRQQPDSTSSTSL
ncbi:hypothetical protein Tco_0213516 [Tanacetum coccineum]